MHLGNGHSGIIAAALHLVFRLPRGRVSPSPANPLGGGQDLSNLTGLFVTSTAVGPPDFGGCHYDFQITDQRYNLATFHFPRVEFSSACRAQVVGEMCFCHAKTQEGATTGNGGRQIIACRVGRHSSAFMMPHPAARQLAND